MNRRHALLGLSAVGAHALLPGVLAEAAAAVARLDAGEPWTPKLVPATRAAMLESLVDTVLPATDTPGARAARVHVFADLALRDCYTPAEQQVFTSGLDALAVDCATRHGRPFESCSADERHALVEALDAASYAPDSGPRGSFVRILKDLTLLGFYTSRIGATQALAYEKVPGGYRGCVELGPEQKAWATGIGT
jgi:hypothetical protein